MHADHSAPALRALGEYRVLDRTTWFVGLDEDLNPAAWWQYDPAFPNDRFRAIPLTRGDVIERFGLDAVIAIEDEVVLLAKASVVDAIGSQDWYALQYLAEFLKTIKRARFPTPGMVDPHAATSD